MGGWSNERQISLKSGQAVVQALKSAGCEVVPIDLKDPTTAREEIEIAGIDVAFIALHGHFGEDGGIQTLLEKLDIPYTGSSSHASRKAMDKAVCRELLTSAGILVPEGMVLRIESGKSQLIDFHPSLLLLGPPWIVKPSQEGSSIGVSIVDDINELPKRVRNALQYFCEVLVERYIPGKEITVGILEDSPIVPIEIVPKNRFYDYESKYGGGTQYLIPARISASKIEQAQKIALSVHQILGCRSFSRVDMMMGNDEQLYVLELNTIPGFTDKSLLPKAAAMSGISFTELCMKILESSQRCLDQKEKRDTELIAGGDWLNLKQD